jgi:hypothetical protein
MTGENMDLTDKVYLKINKCKDLSDMDIYEMAQEIVLLVKETNIYDVTLIRTFFEEMSKMLEDRRYVPNTYVLNELMIKSGFEVVGEE